MIPRSHWFGLDRQLDPSDSDVTILGLPFDGACCYRPGAAEAPDRLRELSRTATAVTETGALLEGLNLADLGNLQSGGNTRDYFRAIEMWVSTLPSEVFVIGLGGDHSVSIPLFSGFRRKAVGECGLIWLDAHPDLWDAYDGDRLSHACALRRLIEGGDLNPRRIALLGLRSFSPEEIDYLLSRQIFFMTAHEMAAKGMEWAAQKAIEQVHEADHVYLSLDIDFVDPSAAPGTGLPVPGGPSARETLALLEPLFQKLRIRSMDIVEISPPHDPASVTSFLGVQILLQILGVIWKRKNRYKV